MIPVRLHPFNVAGSDADRRFFSERQDDAEGERRVWMLQIGTTALIAVAAVTIYRMWMIDVRHLVVALSIACAAAGLNLVWLARGASIDLVGNASIAIFYALLVISVGTTGGFYDPNFGWLFAVPLAAALIVGLRTSLFWLGLVAATTLLFWQLAGEGFEVPNLVPVEARHEQALFNRVSFLSGIMVLAISFSITQRRTERSLAVRNHALLLEAACVQLLRHAAMAANEADDFDAAIDSCVARILEDSSWELGLVWEPEPSADGESRFRWKERSQFAGEIEPAVLLQRSRELEVVPGKLALGKVLTTGEPTWAFGSQLEPETSPRGRAALEAGLFTVLAIPVVVRGRVERVLEFFGGEAEPPSSRLVEVLCDVGRQLGRVAERDQLQESVRRSQKLESVGQLAAGIAHEISNPMAYVRSNLGTLSEDWREIRDLVKGGADLDSILTRIDGCDELISESQDGVDRTVAIVRDVRDFATDGAGATECVNVTDLVESALRVATSAKPEGARVEVEIEPDLEFNGLATRMRQVVLNLVMNAMHAISPGGRLRITGSRSTDGVLISVEDDGHGIGSGDLERIFEPFFTTKPTGQGTGLGLYISYEIVRWHGGVIDVESAPGRGTCFSVRLPLLRESIQPSMSSPQLS